MAVSKQLIETPLEGGYTHTIDPLNRIEGDLAIELSIDKKKTVENAKCMGFVYRGFENFLEGKTPFDAIRLSSRACGACSTAHGTAGAYAIESTANFCIPKNAELVRDIF